MYELVWFISGALTYQLLSKLFALTQATLVFKNIEQNILLILVLLSEDISYIKSLRYVAMKDANVDPEKIKRNKLSDKEFFDSWKTICIRNIHASIPNYIKPSFNSWEEGLELLGGLYEDKKREKQKKQ